MSAPPTLNYNKTPTQKELDRWGYVERKAAPAGMMIKGCEINIGVVSRRRIRSTVHAADLYLSLRIVIKG